MDCLSAPSYLYTDLNKPDIFRMARNYLQVNFVILWFRKDKKYRILAYSDNTIISIRHVMVSPWRLRMGHFLLNCIWYLTLAVNIAVQYTQNSILWFKLFWWRRRKRGSLYLTSIPKEHTNQKSFVKNALKAHSRRWKFSRVCKENKMSQQALSFFWSTFQSYLM